MRVLFDFFINIARWACLVISNLSFFLVINFALMHNSGGTKVNFN